MSVHKNMPYIRPKTGTCHCGKPSNKRKLHAWCCDDCYDKELFQYKEKAERKNISEFTMQQVVMINKACDKYFKIHGMHNEVKFM